MATDHLSGQLEEALAFTFLKAIWMCDRKETMTMRENWGGRIQEEPGG